VTKVSCRKNGGRKRCKKPKDGSALFADKDMTIRIYSTTRSDRNDIIIEVFKSKAVLIGSATINRCILSAIAGILEEIRGLGFKDKNAAAFGTYGWSGESAAMIT